MSTLKSRPSAQWLLKNCIAWTLSKGFRITAAKKHFWADTPEAALDALARSLGWDDGKHSILDWRYEVANDYTLLGYAEWLAHQQEIDLCELKHDIQVHLQTAKAKGKNVFVCPFCLAKPCQPGRKTCGAPKCKAICVKAQKSVKVLRAKKASKP